MPLIVSDFHGTIANITEEAQNKAIGCKLLNDAVRKYDLIKIGKLLIAEYLTKRALSEYKKGKLPIEKVYAQFNSAIKGTPVMSIYSTVEEFAKQNSCKIDKNLLRILRTAKKDSAIAKILSSGYEKGILRILKHTEYSDLFSDHDIIANQLKLDDDEKAIGFTLDIYGKKKEIFEKEFIGSPVFRPEKTVYIGNDPEEDGPIAKLLPKGHFIASLIATDDEKQELAAKFNATVPESYEELEKCLRFYLKM
ncbi:MAG: hypothetical protein HZB65_01165 [Candidatus Aenigmarchaeota archaeon]|nr:hypothetical protein [Candidatus Aenigmarchaeota archaeon]